MSGSTWINKDGLPVRFGTDQGVRGAKGGVTGGVGKEREFVLEADLTGVARTLYSADLNNDGTLDGFTGLDDALPAGAVITDQRVVTLVAPAGGTNYVVGTYLANGTAVDDDGIRVAAGTAGALVGTQLAAAAKVAVKTTGTYTAGKVKIIIRYVTK